jgi:hypothetical protein
VVRPGEPGCPVRLPFGGHAMHDVAILREASYDNAAGPDVRCRSAISGPI